MELGNNQAVAVQGDAIVILRPLRMMTRDEALLHAAWIVALCGVLGAGDVDALFHEILEAVRNT